MHFTENFFESDIKHLIKYASLRGNFLVFRQKWFSLADEIEFINSQMNEQEIIELILKKVNKVNKLAKSKIPYEIEQDLAHDLNADVECVKSDITSPGKLSTDFISKRSLFQQEREDQFGVVVHKKKEKKKIKKESSDEEMLSKEVIKIDEVKEDNKIYPTIKKVQSFDEIDILISELPLKPDIGKTQSQDIQQTQQNQETNQAFNPFIRQQTKLMMKSSSNSNSKQTNNQLENITENEQSSSMQESGQQVQSSQKSSQQNSQSNANESSSLISSQTSQDLSGNQITQIDSKKNSSSTESQTESEQNRMQKNPNYGVNLLQRLQENSSNENNSQQLSPSEKEQAISQSSMRRIVENVTKVTEQSLSQFSVATNSILQLENAQTFPCEFDSQRSWVITEYPEEENEPSPIQKYKLQNQNAQKKNFLYYGEKNVDLKNTIQQNFFQQTGSQTPSEEQSNYISQSQNKTTNSECQQSENQGSQESQYGGAPDINDSEQEQPSFGVFRKSILQIIKNVNEDLRRTNSLAKQINTIIKQIDN